MNPLRLQLAPSEPSNPPSITGSTLDQPSTDTNDLDGWDAFWTLYPRHVAKKEAHRAFDRIAKSRHVEILIALTAWRRVWLDRGDMEFVPHAATFLNGERWEDELPAGYTLMPRVSKAAAIAVPEAQGERIPMPEHVRTLLAKLKGGKQ